MIARYLPLTLQTTVAEMYRLIDTWQHDVDRFRWDSVREIFFRVQRVPYVPDELAEECAGAKECIKRPLIGYISGGDCDDKVVLAGAALKRIRVPFRIVTVSYKPDHQMSHTYLEVFAQNAWRPFDATDTTTKLYQERPFTKKLVWPR